MLTSMLTRLKGQVFKIENYEKGETAYKLILGKSKFSPWWYKTATLYKGWGGSSSNLRIEINKRDSTKYKRKSKKGEIFEARYEDLEELCGYLEGLPDERKKNLSTTVENIPKKIKNTVWEALNEPLFLNKGFKYPFELQNIERINESGSKKKERRGSSYESLYQKLSEKIYRKIFSMTNIPHP